MKFSIRDLLLVTVIVAILVAWFIDHRRQAANREAEVTELLKTVQFEREWNEKLLRNTSAPAPNPPKK